MSKKTLQPQLRPDAIVVYKLTDEEWGGTFECEDARRFDGTRVKGFVQVKYMGDISPPSASADDRTYRVMVSGTDDMMMYYDAGSEAQARATFQAVLKPEVVTQDELKAFGFDWF